MFLGSVRVYLLSLFFPVCAADREAVSVVCLLDRLGDSVLGWAWNGIAHLSALSGKNDFLSMSKNKGDSSVFIGAFSSEAAVLKSM